MNTTSNLLKINFRKVWIIKGKREREVSFESNLELDKRGRRLIGKVSLSSFQSLKELKFVCL